jgi:hypothetical protein
MTIPTYTTHTGTHWKKWEGRTACGAQTGSARSTDRVDCESCLELLASWHPDAGWLIKSDAPLNTFELSPNVSYTFRNARHLLKDLRGQQFRWKKALGYFPKLWLEIDTRTLRRPSPAGP